MNELSAELRRQLFKQESEVPFLMLITVTHPSFGSTIRFVQNTEDIVSRGNTFLAFPVKITLSNDDGEREREVSIVFDNVSLALVEGLRSIHTPPDVTIEMILANDPDADRLAAAEWVPAAGAGSSGSGSGSGSGNGNKRVLVIDELD